MSEAKGIWIDGRISEEELQKLEQLFRTAVKKFGKGELPWHFEGEKIDFTAMRKGSTLHVFYSWNYPPVSSWFQGVKDASECLNCFPQGYQKTPSREVWCSKIGYLFEKCPYGVPTPKGVPVRVNEE